MERIAQKHGPQGAQLAVSGNRHFIIRNIGTGPALNVSFDFAPLASKLNDSNRYARHFPYISDNIDVESPISPHDVVHEDYKFTATYESLSGKEYLTEMILHARSGSVVVLRDDWIFKTVDPPNLFDRIKGLLR